MQIDIYKITDENVKFANNYGEFITIKPIKGVALSAKEYFGFIHKYYSSTGGLLTPSEVGCTLSHLEIYKKIVERNIGAIIFEADMDLDDKLVKKAFNVIDLAKKDFIHFGWHPNVHKNIFFWGKSTQIEGLYLIDYKIEFYGSYSYFLSAKAAAELLMFHEKCLMKADPWVDFFDTVAFQPFFCGIFSHPIERGILSSERDLIKLSIFLIFFKKLRVSLLRNIKKIVNKRIIPKNSNN
jgi:glycosyl transferase, family 25